MMTLEEIDQSCFALNTAQQKNKQLQILDLKVKAEEIEKQILYFKSSLNPANQTLFSRNQREFWHNNFSTVLKEIQRMKQNYEIFQGQFQERLKIQEDQINERKKQAENLEEILMEKSHIMTRKKKNLKKKRGLFGGLKNLFN